ncbi:ribbon-helix-helix domain-containing protein [Spirulina subsalsa]|uniref:ribbon-helix-helix domain-containing protein n=1 Tax=Spirulina subsalsa TaxID=54311 RepID=UPI0003113A9D|nr:ribbon-helix-helix domain-containing protein [Spirulina subsalsa]
MASITISLPDDKLERIKQLALETGISPEEFLQAYIKDWLDSSSNDFVRASEYVLTKNAELYQRLA